MEYYSGGNKYINMIKNHLYKKILDNASFIITSNRRLNNQYKNSIFLPDYYYSDQYKKYDSNTKSDEVLCVGTMNDVKDIEGLVRVFSKMNVNLKIIGKFSDKLRYSTLLKNKIDNIEIIDKNLDYDEYYNLIGRTKFVVLPYKGDGYENRTSGVLLEAMFLNCIPIAPKFLLEFNGVDGIGYNCLEELLNIKLSNYSVKRDYFLGENSPYLISNVKEMINKLLKEI